MGVLQPLTDNFQIALLIVTRVGALLSVAPFFSSSVIPFRLRFILSIFLTIVISPMIIHKLNITIPNNLMVYSLLVLEQALIGLIIGFMISTVFSAFQLAGQYFSIQIGFGMNEVLDPLGEISIPVTGQFLNLISILVFLYISGPQLLVQSLFLSFKYLPSVQWNQAEADVLLNAVSHSFIGMFLIAFKIAIPVMGTIFVISTAMGLLAKVAPQMNVMMLAFPVKIMIAFLILFILAPVIISIMSDAILRIFSFTDHLILLWART